MKNVTRRFGGQFSSRSFLQAASSTVFLSRAETSYYAQRDEKACVGVCLLYNVSLKHGLSKLGQGA